MKIVVSCSECSKKIGIPRGKHIKFVCPQCGQAMQFYDVHGENRLVVDYGTNFLSKEENTDKANNMFKNPFSFKGRIRRTEYGISFIIYVIAYVIIHFADESVGDNTILGLAFIPLTWFLLAQNAKRCHDRGNSGWYQLIPFYGFWLLFAESDHGGNEYGPNPKGIGNTLQAGNW
jgi:uncharacterized membrane protein YhaH (DUF805 family)